jgi:single-stranded-DNA-specific exonuclease
MFVVRRIKDQGRSRLVGKEQEHIRLELVDPVTNFTHNGIAFNQASKFELVKSGKPFDIVFTIEENTFSKNNIQLLVKDIRESESNNIAAVLSLLIRNTKDDADVIGGMTTNPEM